MNNLAVFWFAFSWKFDLKMVKTVDIFVQSDKTVSKVKTSLLQIMYIIIIIRKSFS